MAKKMAKKKMAVKQPVADQKEGGVSGLLDMLGGKGKK